jgi:hypothetical protein
MKQTVLAMLFWFTDDSTTEAHGAKKRKFAQSAGNMKNTLNLSESLSLFKVNLYSYL